MVDATNESERLWEQLAEWEEFIQWIEDREEVAS